MVRVSGFSDRLPMPAIKSAFEMGHQNMTEQQHLDLIQRIYTARVVVEHEPTPAMLARLRTLVSSIADLLGSSDTAGAPRPA